MRLNPQSLDLSPEQTSKKIEDFIRFYFKHGTWNKIVVPISGGLDSSVTAALCVQAIGKDKVVGLKLPERKGNPAASKYANQLAEYLKFTTKTIPITKGIKVMHGYRFILSWFPTRALKSILVTKYLSGAKENLYVKTLKGEGTSMMYKSMAAIYIKQRVRLIYTYQYAEANNYMVVGAANRTETMIGMFAKFGIDHLAEIMPIKPLYRSQILQLAEYLGIPNTIISRSPNPDVLPGVTDKYKDFIGTDAQTIDLILHGIEKEMEPEEIAEHLDIPEETIAQIQSAVNYSRHMRTFSQEPNL